MVSYHRLLLSLFLILPMAVFAEDRNIWCYMHGMKSKKAPDGMRIILRDQEPIVRVKCDGRCISLVDIDSDIATVEHTCFDDYNAAGRSKAEMLNGNGDEDFFVTITDSYFAGTCTGSNCNDADFVQKILEHHRSSVDVVRLRYHPPSDYSAANPWNFSIINLASGLLLTLLITYAGLY